MLMASLLVEEEAPPPLIDIDGTVFLQFGFLVVMMLVLSRFMFKPYLRMLDSRDKSIGGAKHEAAELSTRADKVVKDYETQLSAAKEKGAAERARVRQESAAREREIIGAAREEIGRAAASAQETLKRDGEAARKELEAQTQSLALEMAKKVLGRAVSA